MKIHDLLKELKDQHEKTGQIIAAIESQLGPAPGQKRKYTKCSDPFSEEAATLLGFKTYKAFFDWASGQGIIHKNHYGKVGMSQVYINRGWGRLVPSSDNTITVRFRKRGIQGMKAMLAKQNVKPS